MKFWNFLFSRTWLPVLLGSHQIKHFPSGVFSCLGNMSQNLIQPLFTVLAFLLMCDFPAFPDIIAHCRPSLQVGSLAALHHLVLSVAKLCTPARHTYGSGKKTGYERARAMKNRHGPFPPGYFPLCPSKLLFCLGWFLLPEKIQLSFSSDTFLNRQNSFLFFINW